MLSDSSVEVSRLSSENSRLKNELAQCEKDKEFVWSLWKKLQTANPDISAAVSDVQKHEAERREERDNKVLFNTLLLFFIPMPTTGLKACY